MLLLAGSVALTYCADTLVAAKRYQVEAQKQFRKSVSQVSANKAFSNAVRLPTPASPRAVAPLTPVGELEIPVVGLSAMIAEGDAPGVLRVAVGHVPGTALPGEHGNVVLAAHRDTFFRRLGELKRDEVIQISMLGAEHKYQITFTDVVDPKETWVMKHATGDTLTLITCYPFRFIGPAPKRFIVRARKVDISG